MKTYIISRNNWRIGTSRGKHKAVEYIKVILKQDQYEAKWTNHKDGRITAFVNEDLKYTIEEGRER